MVVELDGLVSLQLIPRNARMVQTRKERGFTQANLAMLVGVDSGTISQIETLRLIPNRDLRVEIAEALSVEVKWLFAQQLLSAVETGAFTQRKALCTEEMLKKLIANRTLPALPESMEDQLAKSMMGGSLLEVVRKDLEPRETGVLESRFGLKDDSPNSLEEVGREFNVTRERVRQIEAKALRKLRHPSRRRHINDYLESV